MKTTNSDWMIAANKPYNEITPEEMAHIHDRIQNHDEVPIIEEVSNTIIEEVSNKTIRQRLSYSVSKLKKFIGFKQKH